MSIKYYTDANMDNLIYFQTPKLLLIGEKYKTMNPNAKLLYIVLLDRVKLSMMSGWKDDEGRYYVRLSVEKGAHLLGFSESTFKRAKKELTKYNLLEEKRDGLTMANRLFVGRLDFSDDDVYNANDNVDDVLRDEELHAHMVDKSLKGQKELSDKSLRGQKEPTGNIKKNQLDESNRTTIKNDFIKNDFIKNKDNNKENEPKIEDVKKKEEQLKKDKTAVVVEQSELESLLKEKELKVNKATLNKWRSLEQDETIILAIQNALGKPNVQNLVGYITGMLERGYEHPRASEGHVENIPSYIINQYEPIHTEISKEDRLETLELLYKLGEIDHQEYTERVDKL